MPAKLPNAEIGLPELIRKYGTSETACRDVLEELRWPDGPVCSQCGETGATRVKGRDTLDCNSCHYQFSVRVGTVLQDSKLPLWTWFLATYVMVESRKGVSSNQLKRMLGVSYKTAWYLSHRIRAAMGEVEGEPLSGIIEVDETYIGGKTKAPKRKDGIKGLPKGYNARTGKVMVLGIIERGGELRMNVHQKRDRATIDSFIAEHVTDDAVTIYTDQAPVYTHLADEMTTHASVNHQKEEWVRGDVHTNTVESAWSLLKRSIIGSYHQLSEHHLQAYLDEMEWRFNNRQNPHLFRDTLKVIVSSSPLGYQELIARS